MSDSVVYSHALGRLKGILAVKENDQDLKALVEAKTEIFAPLPADLHDGRH